MMRMLPTDADKLLYKEALLGHFELVKRLLVLGADPNTQAESMDKDTALHAAVYHANVGCVRIILSHPRTKSDLLDALGKTPFSIAVECVAQCILEKATRTDHYKKSVSCLKALVIRESRKEKETLLCHIKEITQKFYLSKKLYLQIKRIVFHAFELKENAKNRYCCFTQQDIIDCLLWPISVHDKKAFLLITRKDSFHANSALHAIPQEMLDCITKYLLALCNPFPLESSFNHQKPLEELPEERSSSTLRLA